jgi:hypothetical protein
VSETPCTKRSDIMTSIETLLRIKGWLINTSPLEPPCLRGTGERCFRSTTAPSKAFGHGPVMPIAGYPQGCTSAWAATITISIMERMRYLAQILTAEIVLFSHVGVDALLFVFVAVSCSYNKKPSRSYKNSSLQSHTMSPTCIYECPAARSVSFSLTQTLPLTSCTTQL